MKYAWLGMLVVIATGMTSFAQQQRCAQHLLERQLRSENPLIDQAFEAFDAEMAAASNKAQRAELRIIPVVFHVIHMNGPENISDEQIHDAMRIINEDFRGLNGEISQIIPEFQGIIGDGEIEFRLARLDPSGNPTSGIDRIQSNETYVGDDGSKLNNWPRDEYLNIWTVDVISIANAAAYAYRPPAVASNPSVDGIMCDHRYVGSIGTGSSGSSSHTLTHEIGHYLGLRHPWGGTNEPELTSNCTIDDGISDTPNTIGTSGGCPLSQVTCGSLDNVQNFMDYASCEAMFTEGQVNAMRSALSSSVAQRNQLWQSSNLTATGVNDLYSADFRSTRQTVCLGEVVQLYDQSQYDATSWSWVVEGPEVLTSSEENPSLDLRQPGVYNVALTVKKNGNSKAMLKDAYIVVATDFGEALPFSEDFENYETATSVWAVNNPLNNDYYWQPYEGTGTIGERSFQMNNFGNGMNIVDELILGAVDARSVSNMSISFKAAYSQVSTSSSDELKVLVSNDCGETWRTVLTKSGAALAGSTPNIQSNFSPTSSDWETFSVSSIPEAWVGESTFVKFAFTSGGGNHLYLDDINIDGTFKPIPQLVYPADEAMNMNADVKLDWRAVKEVSGYEYQLDVANDFSSNQLQTGTTTYLGASSDDTDTEFRTSDLTPGQEYFWRVRAVNDGEPSDWSEAWSFSVASEGVAGIRPTSWDQNLVVYPNPAREVLRIRLTGERAGSMEVEVLDMTGRTVIPVQYVGSKEEYTVSTAELSGGWYVLKVKYNDETAFRSIAVSR